MNLTAEILTNFLYNQTIYYKSTIKKKNRKSDPNRKRYSINPNRTFASNYTTRDKYTNIN